MKKNEKPFRRFFGQLKFRVLSQPVFWRTQDPVLLPNTFFNRNELKDLWGHTQRMCHKDRYLLSRLSEARIQGIRSWEYGRLLTILRDYPEHSTWRVLDVGTGNSTFPGYLLNEIGIARMITLDYFLSLEVQTAINRDQELKQGIERVAGSMLELPFRSGSFDLVTCISVIEHLDEDPISHRQLPYSEYLNRTKIALNNLMNVVCLGGRLYLTTDVYVPGLQRTDNWRSGAGEGVIWSAYKIKDIKDVFLDTILSNGFNVVGGFDYLPEHIIQNSDRSIYRGRYFSTFCLFAEKRL